MKFIDVLFCDDIRVEINNKVSLMGLYNDRLVFHTPNQAKVDWPINIDLAMLVRFSIDNNEKHPVSFTFECFSHERSVFKIDGNVDLAVCAGSVFALILNTKNTPLHPGDLGYSLKIYDKDTEYLSEVNKTALKVIHDS